jgi:hypothetical protein|nr:MAG TPA: hypothetical protein [Caudoviricetes sp.]
MDDILLIGSRAADVLSALRKAQFYPRRYMAAAQSPAYAAPCAKRHKLLRLF